MDRVKFTGSRYAVSEAHWKQFAGLCDEDFLLSQKRSAPASSDQWAICNSQLDDTLVTALNRMVNGSDMGFFVCCVAAFGIVLNRYSGRQWVLVDSPLLLTNTSQEHHAQRVPLFLQVQPDKSVRDQLQQTQQTVKGAYTYQHYPLELIEQTRSGFGTNVLIAHESLHELSSVKGYDLALSIRPEKPGQTVQLVARYQSDQFDSWFVHNLLQHLTRVLATFTRPDTLVQTIELLSASERQQILYDFNSTARPYPHSKTVQRLFEEQVERTPDAIAVRSQNSVLSYRQLNERANQLAHQLIEQYAVQAGDRVGIRLDRTERLMIGLLAILKAGAAYVPIDPDYPLERQRYIIQDSTIQLLLAEQDTEADHCPVLSVAHWHQSDVVGNPAPRSQPDDPIYIIYTSGTTGQPKGVEVAHRSIVNLSHWLSEQIYRRHPQPLTALLTASINFDASVQQLFAPLLNGSSLVLISESCKKDPQQYIRAICDYGVDVIDITPAYLKAVLLALDQWPEPPRLRYTLVGGEALTPDLVANYTRIWPRNNTLINVYGVTEAAVNSTFEVVGPLRNSSKSIGRPLPNTQIFVVDVNGQLAPIGVAGELLIGGDGVAIGYVGRPDLTSSRFIDNPFAEGNKVYRTGDLARWMPDGTVEFLGRNDSQVKIRGYRIEPEEIERVLLRHPQVDQLLVDARSDAQGDKFLIAYVVGSVGVREIRAFAEQYLPAYMIPAYFVTLAAMPLTGNGKVNRKALPEPEQEECFIAPQSELEQQIAGIWGKVLSRDKVSLDANFFEIGGHSLKATQLITQVYKELGITVELQTLFKQPVLADWVKTIAAVPKGEYRAIQPVAKQPYYDVSHAQKRLWIINQLDDNPVAYNIAEAKRLDGPLHRVALQRAFDYLIQRHESLRTTFQTIDGELKQHIHDGNTIGPILEYVDVSQRPDAEAYARQLTQEAANTPFDLERGPLFRAKLIGLSDDIHLIVLVLHHIVSDGWSMGVLVRDVLAAYTAYAAGNQPVHSPLPIQYKDYAAWQQEFLRSSESVPQQRYWQQKFRENVSALPLATDFKRSARQTFNGKTLRFQIDASLCRDLHTLSRQYHVTLFTTLLSCLKVSLYRATGAEDIVIGSPIAGRIHPDLDDQIGFYVNTLPLRDQLDGDESFRKLLLRINQTVSDAFRYQAYPFDKVVETLDEPVSRSRSSLFDVMMMLQNFDQVDVQISDMQVLDYSIDAISSKFDLLLSFQEKTNELVLDIEYNSDLFKPARIDRFASQLKTIMAQVVQDPSMPIDDIDMVHE